MARPLHVDRSCTPFDRARRCSSSIGVLLYEATDTTSGRTVAVRIVRDEVLRDPARLEKFQIEACRPTAIDFGNVAGLPFFVATEWETPPPLEPLIPIYVEEPRPKKSRTRAWVAVLVVTGLAGAGGWYVGRETSRVARAPIAAPP